VEVWGLHLDLSIRFLLAFPSLWMLLPFVASEAGSGLTTSPSLVCAGLSEPKCCPVWLAVFSCGCTERRLIVFFASYCKITNGWNVRIKLIRFSILHILSSKWQECKDQTDQEITVPVRTYLQFWCFRFKGCSWARKFVLKRFELQRKEKQTQSESQVIEALKVRVRSNYQSVYSPCFFWN
jgi:hypothetical protein